MRRKDAWAAGILLEFLILMPLSMAVAEPTEIIVSAAASLTNAFQDVGKGFEAREKGAKVLLNLGSSGDLLKQIEAGAPVDLYAPASRREMDQLEAKGLSMPITRRVFAGNSLVLVRPTASKIALQSFGDLRKADVRRISIGNPETVPAGMYAEQVLRHLKLWDEVKVKIIFGESVRQVLDYVARGEVDAGIVFSTDAATRPKEVLTVVQAPQGSHSPILYPIALVKGCRNEKIATAFVQFLLSPEGKNILGRYGFKAPSKLK